MGVIGLQTKSLSQAPFIMGTTFLCPWEAGKCLSLWGSLWSYGIIFEVSYEAIFLVLGRSCLENWAPSWALGLKGKRGQTGDSPQKNAKTMTKGIETTD